MKGLPPEQKLRALERLFDWNLYARPSQLWPPGDWSTWLINAGRGFGKTRTGSEVVTELGAAGGHRIALVARTSGDLRDVLVEGPSGVLARRIVPPHKAPHYEPSKRRLTWPRPPAGVAPDGQVSVAPQATVATTFTGEEPDMLRGPEHSFAWCDELASWKYLSDAWSNLKLGLRVEATPGWRPRTVVTTTPRPLRFYRDLMKRSDTVVTGGSTYENVANLPEAFLEEVEDLYGGTTRGRQELYAEILEEAEGALWRRKWIEDYRVREYPDLFRLVVAGDPAVSSNEQSDETGIVVAGAAIVPGRGGKPEAHYYVLEDCSLRAPPLEWAQRLITALNEWDGDRIVGEVNNGGELIETTLRTIDDEVPFVAVHASRGKDARAEPISALYQQGRVHHVGEFVELEDQLCNWEPHGDQRSPDRLDALVWAITELQVRRDMVTDISGIGPADRRGSKWDVG